MDCKVYSLFLVSKKKTPFYETISFLRFLLVFCCSFLLYAKKNLFHNCFFLGKYSGKKKGKFKKKRMNHLRVTIPMEANEPTIHVIDDTDVKKPTSTVGICVLQDKISTGNTTVFRSTWTGHEIPQCVKQGQPIIVKRCKNAARSQREIKILQTLIKPTNPNQDFFAVLLASRVIPNKFTEIILQDGGDDLHFTFMVNGRWQEDPKTVDWRIMQTTQVLTRAFCCLVKLHSLGLYHGDVKPENFVMDAITHHVRMIDFESCQFQHMSKFGENVNACSTLLYSHPRACVGKPVDGFTADLWSFGQMAFTLYCGLSLFDTHVAEERCARQSAFLNNMDWATTYSHLIPKHLQHHKTYWDFVNFVTMMCSHAHPDRPLKADMLVLQHPFLCAWQKNCL